MAKYFFFKYWWQIVNAVMMVQYVKIILKLVLEDIASTNNILAPYILLIAVWTVLHKCDTFRHITFFIMSNKEEFSQFRCQMIINLCPSGIVTNIAFFPREIDILV